jgi:CRISPR-associated endonuclease/helicase Cas3
VSEVTEEISFDNVFQRATGFQPFPYQRSIAENKEGFHELLKIPTGAGKTAGIVLSWIWRRRFASEEVRVDTPRRLVYCLPMRVLVEQTYEETILWLDRLGLL